jgi:lipopolysaccharide transport system ATP-binding protein
MSSSTTHDSLAIRLQNVSKIYKLHASQGDQFIDVLGLQRFGIKTKKKPKEFPALSNISLDVPRGNRIAILGRNGAGKTTLLKLICGNFSPTSGEVEVNGTVQALMSLGLGFHPEYTGRENAQGSLQYNGLNRDEYQSAMDSIVDFCELGDFLDQPLKTYSLGMQARLMFAAATAIRPDILIVDEVLGAGDAYFLTKSKQRVQALIDSGCTMLLVSHSMQQVLEMCDRAVWIDRGEIVLAGKSIEVVKEYEKFVNQPIKSAAKAKSANNVVTAEQLAETEKLMKPNPAPSWHAQEPYFKPHGAKVQLKFPPFSIDDDLFRFLTPDGLSRWEKFSDLKFVGSTIVTSRGETNKIFSLEPVKFCFLVQAKAICVRSVRFGFAAYNIAGESVIRILSQPVSIDLEDDAIKEIGVNFNPLQLGPGSYTYSLSIIEATSMEHAASAELYDVVNRSMQFDVEVPAHAAVLSSLFFHSAEWEV